MQQTCEAWTDAWVILNNKPRGAIDLSGELQSLGLQNAQQALQQQQPQQALEQQQPQPPGGTSATMGSAQTPNEVFINVFAPLNARPNGEPNLVEVTAFAQKYGTKVVEDAHRQGRSAVCIQQNRALLLTRQAPRSW